MVTIPIVAFVPLAFFAAIGIFGLAVLLLGMFRAAGEADERNERIWMSIVEARERAADDPLVGD